MGAGPSQVDLVAEPRGNLPIVPWFMASRGEGLCLGITLICSSSGWQRVWDKHHPHAGRGTQPSDLLVLMCWRMIPASARTELLHQSKGMKLLNLLEPFRSCGGESKSRNGLSPAMFSFSPLKASAKGDLGDRPRAAGQSSVPALLLSWKLLCSSLLF